MEKLKILVVDDEPSICKMVLRFLKMNNYDGESASNGKEAIQMLEKGEFQAVLTDIKMPEMDGITLMKVAKNTFPNLIFIIMSGFGTLDSAIESMKLGALNFIKKPISIVELIATIKKAEDLLTNRNLSLKMKQFIRQIEKDVTISTRELNEGLEMVVNYFISDIKNFGIDKPIVDNLTLALYEALSNAIEHGNLNLKKELNRETNVEDFEKFLKAKMDMLNIPEMAEKTVDIAFTFIDGKITLRIKDQGKGFDYQSYINQDKKNVYGEEKLRRGLFMIQNVMDEISFNDQGNEIIMSVNINE